MNVLGQVFLIPYFLNALSQNTYFWFVFNTFQIELNTKINKKEVSWQLWHLYYELFFFKHSCIGISVFFNLGSNFGKGLAIFYFPAYFIDC